MAPTRPSAGMRSTLVLAIAAGGALGAWARMGVVDALPAHAGRWPWATFVVNMAGSFLLGLLATRLLERTPPSTYRRPLVGTGFCGAFTTFSTFQVEALDLARHDHALLALGYAAASVGAGFVLVAVATALVRRPWLVLR